MAPTVLGEALGGLDGTAEARGDVDGVMLAAEPEHAARTTTRATRAAERDIIDMAA